MNILMMSDYKYEVSFFCNSCMRDFYVKVHREVYGGHPCPYCGDKNTNLTNVDENLEESYG